jgi:hypothetical protein
MWNSDIAMEYQVYRSARQAAPSARGGAFVSQPTVPTTAMPKCLVHLEVLMPSIRMLPMPLPGPAGTGAYRGEPG